MDSKDSLLDELFYLPLSAYRLSPLHFSPNKPLLSHLSYYSGLLAKHFKRVNPYAIGKVGTLKRCTLVSRDDEESEGCRNHRFGGILIRLEFENKTLPVFLLSVHDIRPKASEKCIYYPLLLTSTPNHGHETLLESLAATFGTYAHPLQLSTHFMQQSLDDFLDVTLKRGRQFMEQATGDVSFTLDFAADIAPSLKHLDFGVQREDLFGFVQRGYALLAQKGQSPPGEKPCAFATAVHDYMHHNMAMDLSHKSISIAKIACGSFVLEKSGKVKLLSPVVNDEIDGDASPMPTADLAKEAYADLLKRLIIEAEGKIKWTGLGYT